MNILEELASRCEQADGPDRELDLAIHLALWPGSEIADLVKCHRGFDGREGRTWEIGSSAVLYQIRLSESSCYGNGSYPLPTYTASLDAAISLLRDGYALERISCWPDQHSDAVVLGTSLHRGQHWHSAKDGKWSAKAATPALALCAAAVRSHQPTSQVRKTPLADAVA